MVNTQTSRNYFCETEKKKVRKRISHVFVFLRLALKSKLIGDCVVCAVHDRRGRCAWCFPVLPAKHVEDTLRANDRQTKESSRAQCLFVRERNERMSELIPDRGEQRLSFGDVLLLRRVLRHALPTVPGLPFCFPFEIQQARLRCKRKSARWDCT